MDFCSSYFYNPDVYLHLKAVKPVGPFRDVCHRVCTSLDVDCHTCVCTFSTQRTATNNSHVTSVLCTQYFSGCHMTATISQVTPKLVIQMEHCHISKLILKTKQYCSWIMSFLGNEKLCYYKLKKKVLICTFSRIEKETERRRLVCLSTRLLVYKH